MISGLEAWGKPVERRPSNGSAGNEPAHAGLVVLRIDEFLALDIKPREMVLDPIIPEQGLAMVYSWRGVGKTLVALGVGFAVATGGKFLRWNAPRARRVVYLDGEMPAHEMQRRLAAIAKTGPDEIEVENFRIVTPDQQELGMMPNLSTEEGQATVEQFLVRDGKRIADLLIIDNIATLCRAPKDNEADSWALMQGWLLKLRRLGISVLLVHHEGKGGAQRGTSAREDILDTSIRLSHPGDYQANEGAVFEVHYLKARGLYGKAADPFEAKLETRNGIACWTTRTLEDVTLTKARELLADDVSIRDMAEILGISKSAAHRLKRKINADATARTQ